MHCGGLCLVLEEEFSSEILNWSHDGVSHSGMHHAGLRDHGTWKRSEVVFHSGVHRVFGPIAGSLTLGCLGSVGALP